MRTLHVHARCEWCAAKVAPDEAWLLRGYAGRYCRGCTIAILQHDPDDWYEAEAARLKERAPA